MSLQNLIIILKVVRKLKVFNATFACFQVCVGFKDLDFYKEAFPILKSPPSTTINFLNLQLDEINKFRDIASDHSLLPNDKIINFMSL